jgi:hypothetical protein
MHIAFVSAVAASLASLAAAVVTPTGAAPSGNAIPTPTQDQVLPVGVPFTIKWTVRRPNSASSGLSQESEVLTVNSHPTLLQTL